MSFASLRAHAPVVVIDGALATELERHGADLNHRLWSARLLRDEPERIGAVHRAYLAAGAQILITASYQATIPGFVEAGYSEADAIAAIRCSVTLACAARDAWVAAHPTAGYRPLVAGSVGPYGAYTADGGEYRGQYGLSVTDLMAFHQPRIALLVAAGVDLIACETIPDVAEIEALARCLAVYPHIASWISVSCGDAATTWAGQSMQQVAACLAAHPHVSAVGVNCTAPEYVEALVADLHRATDLPIVVYPNSGEVYDPTSKTWSGTADTADYVAAARRWVAAGASIVGGCCRTTPAHIAALARHYTRQTET